MQPGKLWGLRRLADSAGRFKMLAVDQRPPIKNLIADKRGTETATYQDVCDFKRLLVEVLGPHASAVLLDPHYAYPAAIEMASPAQGLLLTLEDSIFEETPAGRLSAAIDHWSVAKIKRAGGDAVKVLAWYRPDAAPHVVAHQQEFVQAVGDQCRRHDIPFVFELLVYPFPADTGHKADYVEDPAKRADHVVESVATFSDPKYGVDLFKLESPIAAAAVPQPEDDDGTVQASFDELGRAAARPWVMLSAGATPEAFRRILHHAYAAGASGYLAGRAIWWEAGQAFPDLEAMRRGLSTDSVPYMQAINLLTDERANPWRESAGPPGAAQLENAGPNFRFEYPATEDA